MEAPDLDVGLGVLPHLLEVGTQPTRPPSPVHIEDAFAAFGDWPPDVGALVPDQKGIGTIGGVVGKTTDRDPGGQALSQIDDTASGLARDGRVAQEGTHRHVRARKREPLDGLDEFLRVVEIEIQRGTEQKQFSPRSSSDRNPCFANLATRLEHARAVLLVGQIHLGGLHVIAACFATR